jgi:hypothetical protein
MSNPPLATDGLTFASYRDCLNGSITATFPDLSLLCYMVRETIAQLPNQRMSRAGKRRSVRPRVRVRILR